MPAALVIFLIFIAVLGVAAIAIRILRSPIQSGRRLLHWLTLLRGGKERFLETPSGHVHYYEMNPRIDSRRTVVFLTGLSGTGVDWHEMLAAASKRGWRTFSPEMAGQGRTRLKDRNRLYSMPLQVELLRDFLDARQLDQITLVGISLGGWIASLFAICYPERLRHLVLVSSAGLWDKLSPRDVQPRNREEARLFLNRILARDPWFPGFILDDFVRRLNSTAVRRVIRAITAEDFLDARLHRIHLPVDLIWGAQDELIGTDQAHQFKNAIPHARLHLIPRCGHIPMVERPLALRRLMMDILESRQ